jgi:protein O-GlcNAc transferase
MVEIAKIHFTENDLKGAEVMLRRALALRPDVADTHYTLGVCLMDAGNPAAAEAAFVTAIRLGPGNFMAYSNAGTCAMRLGRLDAAVMYFDEALRLNPNDTLAKANLDLVLKAQNRARRRM